MRYLMLIILAIVFTSCYHIPPEIVDSVKILHASNVTICEDYVDLLPLHYHGDELVQKYNLVLKHLELSKELVKAVEKYK